MRRDYDCIENPGENRACPRSRGALGVSAALGALYAWDVAMIEELAALLELERYRVLTLELPVTADVQWNGRALLWLGPILALSHYDLHARLDGMPVGNGMPIEGWVARMGGHFGAGWGCCHVRLRVDVAVEAIRAQEKTYDGVLAELQAGITYLF